MSGGVTIVLMQKIRVLIINFFNQKLFWCVSKSTTMSIMRPKFDPENIHFYLQIEFVSTVYLWNYGIYVTAQLDSLPIFTN